MTNNLDRDGATITAAEANGHDSSVDELFRADGNIEPGLIIQFPSADFPAPPAFRLRVPAGWLAVPTPDAELAVRDPEAIDGFHPNVVVRVRRVPASDEVADQLLHAVDRDAAPDGVEVVSEEVRTDLETPARWMLVRFRGPSGRLLLGRHLLVYVPASEHVATIVTAVGTLPASAAAHLGPKMDRIVGSLRLGPPAPLG